jgi:16S rRNA (adenine1518-N6/adenine1519-N6)-dimethyltransferase
VADDRPIGRAATARLLDRHGVTPRKALGQHFLVDPNVVRRIVAAAGIGSGDRVVEIGAGVGTLTRALAAAGAAVTAYEVDERLAPLLEEVLAGSGVDLRIADAAGIDLTGELSEGRWTLVANLPYNVGTPIVLDLLRRAPAVERFVVMLQREAVERLSASPGTRVYGLPSVVIGLYGMIEVLFRVPPSVFLPVPRVESAVASIRRRPAPEASERAIALAAAGFGQRRKMLRSSLRAVLDDPVGALEAAGIDPTRRAEQLTPEDYVLLAEVADAG